MMTWLRRHPRRWRTCCWRPGLLYLAMFYVVPTIQMFLVSLWTGSLRHGLPADLELRHLSGGDQRVLARSSSARWSYGGLATLLAFALGFPLAYFIAFRGGRYKSLLLFLVIAPFFTSFLLRTISWKIILADNGMLLGPLKDIGLLPESFRLLATPIAVIAGITYNFLPFMTLPLYVALEKIPPSVLEAAQDLYADTRSRFLRVTFPLALPGIVAGLAAHVHPGRG